jgi:hypothetical protein
MMNFYHHGLLFVIVGKFMLAINELAFIRILELVVVSTIEEETPLSGSPLWHSTLPLLYKLRHTKVVGLTSNGNIMFNKQLNWKMKMNHKSTAFHAGKQKCKYKNPTDTTTYQLMCMLCNITC